MTYNKDIVKGLISSSISIEYPLQMQEFIKRICIPYAVKLVNLNNSISTENFEEKVKEKISSLV